MLYICHSSHLLLSVLTECRPLPRGIGQRCWRLSIYIYMESDIFCMDWCGFCCCSPWGWKIGHIWMLCRRRQLNSTKQYFPCTQSIWPTELTHNGVWLEWIGYFPFMNATLTWFEIYLRCLRYSRDMKWCWPPILLLCCHWTQSTRQREKPRSMLASPCSSTQV